MKEQMDTMGGVMSNIEDAFGKLARNIGEAGLTTAIKNALQQFNDMIEGADEAANTIGKTLTKAVNLAADAFFLLADHADTVLTLLSVRFGAKAITGGLTLLKAGIGYVQTALLSMSVQAKSAVAGIAMMSSVSKLAAAQMTLTATAVGVLRGALALIGGPAGLVLLTVAALYKLVDSHDVAKRAASDHAETLKRLQAELKATTEEAAKFSSEQSKDMALAEWSLKLKTAEQNIKDLRAELKNNGGLSLTTRLTPNALLKDYEVYAKDWAEVLRQSKIDLQQYEKEIWALAAEYPDFKPQADEIQQKILLLKAAEQDAVKARQELSYIENPQLRPTTPEIKTPEQTNEIKTSVVASVDDSAYQKAVADIKQKALELKTPYEQAMIQADEWRNNTLKDLNASASDYETYKQQVEAVYEDMVKKADETALNTSKEMTDGFKRGFINLQNELDDFATLAESTVKNTFNSMEDALVTFVTTGKTSISDLVNSIVQDFAKLAIRQSITQPLMSGLSAYMGFSTAHSGGIIGLDTLKTTYASLQVFSNAPKFHSGGIVGDEVPIIAKRGEGVFTKEQMKALGENGSSEVKINVNVINNASSEVKASVNKSNNGNGEFSLDVVIEKIESAIGKNISKGEGLSPLLEQRYGLNPAYGSYR
jgi:lambda family phage tail tape measure protein